MINSERARSQQAAPCVNVGRAACFNQLRDHRMKIYIETALIWIFLICICVLQLSCSAWSEAHSTQFAKDNSDAVRQVILEWEEPKIRGKEKDELVQNEPEYFQYNTSLADAQCRWVWRLSTGKKVVTTYMGSTKGEIDPQNVQVSLTD